MSIGGTILQHEWLTLLVLAHVALAVIVRSMIENYRERIMRLELQLNAFENRLYFGSTVLAHRPYDWALEGAA